MYRHWIDGTADTIEDANRTIASCKAKIALMKGQLDSPYKTLLITEWQTMILAPEDYISIVLLAGGEDDNA